MCAIVLRGGVVVMIIVNVANGALSVSKGSICSILNAEKKCGGEINQFKGKSQLRC